MPREIYVDSRRRNEPYGNSYTLYIQTPLKNVTRVDLVSATIPNTVYNITDGSNIFSISGSNCSVANGFYSASSIVSAANSSMNGSTKLVFLSEEGKFMFYNTTSSFTLKVLSHEFSTVSGFPKDTTISSQVASASTGIYSSTYAGSNFIKSDYVANFKTCGEYIYLDIDELRRPFGIDAVTNVYESQSFTTFAIIPLDVSSGCIKTFKEQTDYKIEIEYPKPIDKIDRLTINWRDFKGNLVNFNGVDENSFILRFYEEEDMKFLIGSTNDYESVIKPVVSLTKPDKRTVFVMLFLSLVFILFMKRK